MLRERGGPESGEVGWVKRRCARWRSNIKAWQAMHPDVHAHVMGESFVEG
jgi:predicted Fe-S protein YdhL (DUF1289 family)